MSAFAVGILVYDATHPPVAEASGGGGSASAQLVGSATGDRLTLTSTSGVALTATGQGSGDGAQFTGGGTANTDGVQGTGGSGGGPGVHGFGTGLYSGGQFEAAANGGAAIYLAGDTTSPASALIRISGALNANPSTTSTIAVGDLFPFTGGYWRVATDASTPIWNDISAFRTVVTGVTAFAGGGQASATAVCTSGNLTTVNTVATAADSVKLPATPVVGQICVLKNKGANSMNLFPGSGDVLCVSGGACSAANAATAVAANGQIECYAESASTWNCR